VVIGAATILIFACGGSSKPAPTPTAVTTTQASATSTATSARETPGSPGAAALTLLALKSFQATITITTPNQPQQFGILEASLPDRYHITIGQVEVINIGDDTYLRSGGDWVKQQSAAGARSLNGQAIAAAVSNAAKQLQSQTLTKGSTDTISSKTCQLYLAGPDQFCIGPDTLPFRIVSVQPDGSRSTIVFTSFNGTVDIKAPI
jgi:hypothetical protein